MGYFYGSGGAHKPDEQALVMDITGVCNKCHHRGSARLVAYYSGEILIRCNYCKTANQFSPDDETYLDPTKFLPFRSDKYDELKPGEDKLDVKGRHQASRKKGSNKST